MTSSKGSTTGDRTRGRVAVTRGADGRPLVLPRGVILAAVWALCLAIICVVLYGFAFLVLPATEIVTTPLLLAVLLAALLHPPFRLLRNTGMPGLLAAIICVVVLLAAVGATLWLVGREIVIGVTQALDQAELGLDQVIDNVSSALALDADQVRGYLDTARSAVSVPQQAAVDQAVSITGTLTTVVSGVLLGLFATVFFLSDGPRIWALFMRFVPREGRLQVDEAGRRSWNTVGSYVRVVPIVAFADAVGIGLGAALLGVPLALPIAVLTFVAAFVPIIGAVVAGAAAGLIALVSQGPTTAALMVLVVLLVQQIESNVLHPLLIGRALQLHPLAVVLMAAGGITLAGIVGGVLAVPVLAAAVTSVATVRSMQAGEGASTSDPPPAGAPEEPGATSAQAITVDPEQRVTVDPEHLAR